MTKAMVLLPLIIGSSDGAGTRLMVQSMYFVAFFGVMLPTTIWRDLIPRGSRYPSKRIRRLKKRRLERPRVRIQSGLALDLGNVSEVAITLEPGELNEVTVLWDDTELRFSTPPDADVATRRCRLALGLPERRGVPPVAYDVEIGYGGDQNGDLKRVLDRLTDATGIDFRLISTLRTDDDVPDLRRRYRCGEKNCAVTFVQYLGLPHVDVDLTAYAAVMAEAQLRAALDALRTFRRVAPLARPSPTAHIVVDLLDDAIGRPPPVLAQRAALARAVLHDALTDPTLALPQYFPTEHLLAIYAPFFAPLIIPVAYGQYEEWIRFRRLSSGRQHKLGTTSSSE